jgi:alginate O-acetyltransferase complex protein AlgI
VLFANPLGALADTAFCASDLSSGGAWLGLFAYAFQIYFDFSGYSDMAIGLGRMLGFEFLENFDRPYRSRDFMEFWRRWHISLSSWMREYLYVPLGGNRKGAARTHLNLWLVFLFSGFWHGASWSFVLWGAYHGLFISLQKAAKDRNLPALPGAAAVPVNFLLVCLGWVLFRAETLPAALAYYRALFAFDAAPLASVCPDARGWTVLGLAALAVFLPGRHLDRLSEGTGRVWLRFATAVLLLILSAAALANSGFNPFIYFRF